MFAPIADIAVWIKAHESLCWWLTIASALTFIATLLVLPLLLIRIPADYFTRQHSSPSDRHPVVYWSMVISKNVLGIMLLLAGIAMLFLPGQGIITILLAVTLLNFPGKRKLEQRLICLPGVLATINKIRQRAKQPPLLAPDLKK